MPMRLWEPPVSTDLPARSLAIDPGAPKFPATIVLDRRVVEWPPSMVKTPPPASAELPTMVLLSTVASPRL